MASSIFDRHQREGRQCNRTAHLRIHRQHQKAYGPLCNILMLAKERKLAAFHTPHGRDADSLRQRPATGHVSHYRYQR
jgi:hypothetical protein